MKEKFLGVDVSSYTYNQLKKNIISDIEQNKQSFIVAINPEKILQAQKNVILLRLLNQATYQIPDGVGVLLASKIYGGNISERVTGIDMLLTLCEQASTYGKSIFLYGAQPGVAEKAKENLLRKYPNLNIVGVMDGYVDDHEYIKKQINAAKPDILCVGLGSPRQENWIVDNMKNLDVRIFQGVGGSFDVLSGRVKRAPATFQRFGIEWLYRLITEPWRIKRQIKLPMFLYKVWKNKKYNYS
ncbi:WecB/TagA/CpsF family glycosyltransferase [Halobacillus shinanisalinarum]|uniref:N-acetylglucosaminyldiphosphoundecaprenol N-acetyl-beta-D-mannosaminyltransferase n=1 Tax=Halobacillus shinanisalinarum TaxID=2932258 RepID=A0ABY4H4C5_9BACI|nr:WecB/TagA/CpsF family glycosyltransferase [Halobacillus shinanisalinarum]UOQ94427.1 WecB/TagA/CpsF family glycosyltransferase [Halobacillus shinanisalinarum]